MESNTPKDFADYSQWLDAATKNGFKIETDVADQSVRHALDDNREHKGTYKVGENKGSLDVPDDTKGAVKRIVPDYSKPDTDQDTDGDRLRGQLKTGSVQPTDGQPAVGTPKDDDGKVRYNDDGPVGSDRSKASPVIGGVGGRNAGNADAASRT